MKLNSKNLDSGKLLDGRDYKISILIANGYVTLYFKVEEDGTYWVNDIISSVYNDGYKTVTEALETVIKACQDEHQIQLINGN